MNPSRPFIFFNWLTLVLIYLVVVAGSFVRITGSGMGCPDWPRCFGQWVPPTAQEQLPDNYRSVFLEKRENKIKKFCSFLRKIGLEKTALQIEQDPGLLVEEPFNAAKTWTEYVNRLLGFLAGNAMLFGFGWLLMYYRKRKWLLLAALNLVLMAVEAWFGSIVVASNLVPWTITVHMLLALVIIGIQLYMVAQISPSQQKKLSLPPVMKVLLWAVLLITIYQMFLGTQVREYIDALTRQGYGRDSWTDKLGWDFFIHRSFSWLVLGFLVYIAWQNERTQKLMILRSAFVVLVLELVSGVLLAYADMPGLVQTSHLIFAAVLFGILLMAVIRLQGKEGFY
jgi:cytochrome c oxidase assembly protein subunit 15